MLLSDNFITALSVAIPATITAIASAIVAVKQSNKASAKTDARVDEVKEVVTGNTTKLADVHQTVNGNYTALEERLFQALKENQDLREQLLTRVNKP